MGEAEIMERFTNIYEAESPAQREIGVLRGVFPAGGRFSAARRGESLPRHSVKGTVAGLQITARLWQKSGD
ncbi:MAG: hypothetical protein HPM95_13940 [Alphaproteobacteria bacterium]|nr:hypothetical protein [Alphaproteobacteria bacterium]